MDWRERIVSGPETGHGQACVRGTRIPASVVLDHLADNVTMEELLDNDPSLTRDDVQVAIRYAAELAWERFVPLVPVAAPLPALILLLAMVGLSSLFASPATAAPPNIVVFLVDDLGQRDLGCYGSTFYETPNVDRLAREGMRFTDAYAACPVCSPTRASLITGLWPQRTSITDYIDSSGGNQPANWKRNTILLPSPYSDRLALETTTLAERLKSAGYATFFAGKWHLGPEGHWPENQGFDWNLGGTDRGGPYGGGKYFSPYNNPRLPDGPPGEHLADRLAEETAKFVSANKDRPFLAYFSFYDVHTPLLARDDLRRKYVEKRQRLGLESRFRREVTREVRDVQDHAVYAAMVEAMDLAVGKVLDRLDREGLTDNTLVIFTSDNGGLSTSEGWPTSNSPLRGGKGWLYEGGIRVPFVVRWPGKTRPGTDSAVPVSSPDLVATLLDATGVSHSDNQHSADPLDGVSLVPVLKGETLPDRPLYWHYPHYGNQGGAPGGAIRRGSWKLVEWYEDQRVELFDLSTDPGESRDLFRDQPDRADELRGELAQWRKSVGARFPSVNPAYNPSRPSGRVAQRK